MFPMTPEESAEFMRQLDDAIERENKFLDSRGWIQCLGTFVDHNGKEYVSESWAHPKTLKKYHAYTDAFDLATSDFLDEKGWESVLEIERVGEGKFEKIQKWGRYQSPVTKRLYNFLEAQWYAVERNFDESDYPYGMSRGTVEINNLIKDFKGDEFFVWFHSDGILDKNGERNHIFELWTKEEIREYKVEEAEKISKVMIEACVSAERARYALNWADENVEEAIKRATMV